MLLVVDSTDVVFAVDSVPAILAITTDPFIVWSSNMMAVIGLRSIYFLLSGVMRRLEYIQAGISLVLVFAGAKMLTSEWYDMPTWLSLIGIVSVLTSGTLVAYMVKRVMPRTSSGEARATPES